MSNVDDILEKYPEVSKFIVSKVESGIYLIKFREFPKVLKEYNHSARLSAINGLKSLLYRRAISQDYLKMEWSNFDFEKYLELEMQDICDDVYRFDLREIHKSIDEIINSDSSKAQKINELLRYKEAFSGPFIRNVDYSIYDVVSYVDLKISIIEKQEMPPSTRQKISSDIPNESEPDNPHARYFVNGWHWLLFKEWHDNHVSKKLADYSFIFWVMYEDGFIYSDIGPNAFKIWLENKLDTGNLGKQLKQLRLSDADYKYSAYTTLIAKYKLQSITLQKRSNNTTIS